MDKVMPVTQQRLANAVFKFMEVPPEKNVHPVVFTYQDGTVFTTLDAESPIAISVLSKKIFAPENFAKVKEEVNSLNISSRGAPFHASMEDGKPMLLASRRQLPVPMTDQQLVQMVDLSLTLLMSDISTMEEQLGELLIPDPEFDLDAEEGGN